jgi:biopolymer transport protein ExbD
LLNLASQDSIKYLALYADQNIPYREIVRVLDIANEHDIKIVIATKPFEH